jgi:hypothetical protein
MDIPSFTPGDRLRTRKPHPCGGDVWSVVRVGADLRLRCEKCGHHVTVVRSKFEKDVRERLERA